MFNIRGDQMTILAVSLAGRTLIPEFVAKGYETRFADGTNDLLVTDRRGNTTTLKFDKMGQVSQVITPSGDSYDLTHDANFRVATLSAPQGLKTTFDYWDNGLLRTLKCGADQTWSFEWDQWSNLRKAIYPDKTNEKVDSVGAKLPTSFRDRTGNTSRFERAESGRLLAAVDPLGNRTTFEYAEWDRPSCIVRPDGSEENLTRNAMGRLTAGSVNGKLWAQISYNGEGRIQEIQYDDGHFVAFAYDEAGNVVEARNPTGVVTREYDENKRLVSEGQPGGVVKFGYDATGLLSSLTTPKGETLGFSYDADARLVRVADWKGGVHKFSYETTRRSIKHRLPNQVTTDTLLTERGFPAEIITKLPGLQSLSLKYERNSNDQVTSAADSEAGLKKFSYSPDGFVLRVEDSSGPIETFSYDANGNRIGVNSEDAYFDPLNQMSRQGMHTMRYDSRGNLTMVSASDGETRYKYNGQNLLVEVELPDGRRVEYAYDAFGRRISKKVGGVETVYVWAGNQLIAESVRGSKLEQRDYLFLPNSYTPLSFRVNGKIYQYHTDQRGMPRWVTDEAGELVWSAVASTFGETSVLKQNVKQNIRFAGQYLDEETDLHYNRARYYSPRLGRYLSRDPLEIVAGLNFYLYAGNDPINNADPLGLIGFWQGMLAGAAVVAGVAILVVAAPVVAAAVVAVAAGGAIAAGTIGAAAAVVGGAALLGGGIGLALASEDASPGDQALAALRGAMYGAGAALTVMGAAFGAAGLVAGCGGGGLAAAGAGGGTFVLTNTAANAIGAGAASAVAGHMMMAAAGTGTGGSGATPKNKDNVKYTDKSDKHVADHGHADDGQPKTVDKTATKNAGKTQYKSKFGSSEGGQKFTDEVVDHPGTTKTTQSNGRIRYTNDDLGRTTGTGQDGTPVKGGEVIVEGPSPKPGSNTGDVVTQYPAGKQGP